MSIENFFDNAREPLEALTKHFGSFARINEPIAPYVAYKIGGPADLLILPESEEDLIFISELGNKFQIPITTIGTGTNLLVADEGIRGVTLSLDRAFKEIEVIETQPDFTIIQVGAGVTKPDLLEWSIEHSLGGLEFSAGVPGTIGGGIFMNAGTKYGNYGDILVNLRLFDFDKGPLTYRKDQINFGYRQQSAVTLRTLVLSTQFRLIPADKVKTQTEVDRIVAERAAKQPLDYPSCGSTFKNPDGHSAGRLVEKSGLKGTIIGGAQISEKHANFILNKNKAKASDILALINLIQTTVREQFGVSLETEVVVLGGNYASGQIPKYCRVY